MMIRIVVAWLVFTTMFSAVFGAAGSVNGIYLRDQGVSVYGWEAFFRIGGIGFGVCLLITFFAALGVALVEWLDK